MRPYLIGADYENASTRRIRCSAGDTHIWLWSFHRGLVAHVAGLLTGSVFALLLVMMALGILYGPLYPYFGMEDDEDAPEEMSKVFRQLVTDSLLFTCSAWALFLIAYLVFNFRPPMEPLVIPLFVGAITVMIRLVTEDPHLTEQIVITLARLIWNRPSPLQYHITAQLISLLLVFIALLGFAGVVIVTGILTDSRLVGQLVDYLF
jgi:hypothetical protein